MNDKVTFGKSSWDKPASGSGDDFLQLNKDGQYQVRIIGDAPFEFAIHWVDDAGGANRRAKCAGQDCILCKEGHKASVRYLLEVMNRDDHDKCQIVEFGPQIYNKIVALNKNKHWGSPSRYDILIDRLKSRGASDMYQVMPVGAISPLPPEQEAVAQEFRSRIESVIAKVAGPAKNEEILEKLGRLPTGSAPSKASAPMAADADADFDF